MQGRVGAPSGLLGPHNGLTDEANDAARHGHSGVGACWAKAQWGPVGQLLAYCLAGHHAGLPDWEGGERPNGALHVRLTEERAQLEEPEVQAWLAAHAADLQLPRQKPFPLTERSLAFWLRMHYSCLVDADFLDTERFMDGARAQARGGYRPLAELAERFFAQLAELAANYDTSWVLSTATQPTLPGFPPPATAFSSIAYCLSRNPPGASREGRPG